MFSNKGRRKKQKLKRKPEISQNKEKICVNGYLSDSNFNISGLLLISRETSEHIEIKNRKNGCEFDFQINLNDFYFTESEDPDTFDFYLKIDFQFGDLSIEEQERYIKKTTVLYDETKGTEAHIIRLGRFEKTETNLLNPLMAENLICQLYKTVKGSISLAVNSVVTQEVKNQIDI